LGIWCGRLAAVVAEVFERGVPVAGVVRGHAALTCFADAGSTLNASNLPKADGATRAEREHDPERDESLLCPALHGFASPSLGNFSMDSGRRACLCGRPPSTTVLN